MRMTKEGIALVKGSEGCRLKAYYDGGIVDGVPRGKLTIGWGHTRGVFAGDVCTQEAADAWLLEDLAEFEGGVLQILHEIELNDNQLSALVSFVFNVGYGKKGVKDGFLTLKTGETSTMVNLLRRQLWDAASLEFPKWCKDEHGAVIAGLHTRRLAEQALFNRRVKTCPKWLKPLMFWKAK